MMKRGSGAGSRAAGDTARSALPAATGLTICANASQVGHCPALGSLQFRAQHHAGAVAGMGQVAQLMQQRAVLDQQQRQR